jgi:hypothetical protein
MLDRVESKEDSEGLLHVSDLLHDAAFVLAWGCDVVDH